MHAVTEVFWMPGGRRVEVDRRQLLFGRKLLDQRQDVIVDHGAVDRTARTHTSRERQGQEYPWRWAERAEMFDHDSVIAQKLLSIFGLAARCPIEVLGIIGPEHDDHI